MADEYAGFNAWSLEFLIFCSEYTLQTNFKMQYLIINAMYGVIYVGKPVNSEQMREIRVFSRSP
jgi:hypothetical protein